MSSLASLAPCGAAAGGTTAGGTARWWHDGGGGWRCRGSGEAVALLAAGVTEVTQAGSARTRANSAPAPTAPPSGSRLAPIWLPSGPTPAYPSGPAPDLVWPSGTLAALRQATGVMEDITEVMQGAQSGESQE